MLANKHTVDVITAVSSFGSVVEMLPCSLGHFGLVGHQIPHQYGDKY